jgi:nicotinamidase-related amidase
MRALLLIDIQTGFDSPFWGARNNPDAEAHAARLLAAWRKAQLPIFHVRHISTEIGSPLAPQTGGTAFKPEVEPMAGEIVFEKSVNSGFIGTDLEATLRAQGITDLVICGLTTPHCVSTTSRMAANLGFDVILAHEACASFSVNANMGWQADAAPLTPEEIHKTAVAHLHGEFVTALKTSAILESL